MRLTSLTVALLVTAALAGSTSAQSPQPPTNVLVTPGEGPDASFRPAIARDPARSARLSIAYNQPSNASACYLARSADDGASWENLAVVGPGGQFPLPNGNENQCNRPAIAYGPDGTLYYAFSAITSGQPFPPPSLTYVMASRDGGATFTAPVRVEQETTGVSDINPAVAVDQDSGRLYVVWQANRPSPATVAIASSGDGGQTFSAAVKPFPRDGGPANVAVGPDGRVYVGYRQLQDYRESMGALPMRAMVATSTDGAQTFGAPVTAMDLRSCFNPGNTCQRNPQGAFTFNPSFAIAAGNAPGQIFSVGSYLGDDDIFRFRFGASTDAGLTWTQTGPLGIPAGLEADHQLVPHIAVAPNNRIDIAYYDLAEPSGVEDTYLISSDDGGATFSAPRKITSEPSTTTGNTGNDTYSVGQLLTSSDGGASVAWTDARRGKLDVFFASTAVRAPSPPSGGSGDAAPLPSPTPSPSPGGGGGRDGEGEGEGEGDGGLARFLPNVIRPGFARAVQRGGGAGSSVARVSQSRRGGRIVVRLRGRMIGTRGRRCGGRIKIGTRAGGRRVATRSARMARNCRYSARYTFAARRLPRRLRPRDRTLVLRVLVRYQGNSRLRGDLSPPKRVKVRR